MLPEHEIELFQVRGPVRPGAIAVREIFPASEIVHPVHDSELAYKVVGLVYDRGTGQQDDPLFPGGDTFAKLALLGSR